MPELNEVQVVSLAATIFAQSVSRAEGLGQFDDAEQREMFSAAADISLRAAEEFVAAANRRNAIMGEHR